MTPQRSASRCRRQFGLVIPAVVALLPQAVHGATVSVPTDHATLPKIAGKPGRRLVRKNAGPATQCPPPEGD